MKRPGEENSATIDNSNKNTTQFHEYTFVDPQSICFFLERDFPRNCKAVVCE